MIFVTVGTQLPFDRLVRTVDEWAGRTGRRDVFAQVGPSGYRPKHIEWTAFLDAEQCREKTRQSNVVIAHAGMGSIITALELGRPIIVMPRRARLGEQRNDHQMATVQHVERKGRIWVAVDETALRAHLRRIDALVAAVPIQTHASPLLIESLRQFVLTGTLPTLTPEPVVATAVAVEAAAAEAVASVDVEGIPVSIDLPEPESDVPAPILQAEGDVDAAFVPA